jgi:hypothetical protein
VSGVSVLRASQDAQIFRNDASTLAESLSRQVSKTSAIDSKIQNPVSVTVSNEVAVRRNTPDAGLGLAL